MKFKLQTVFYLLGIVAVLLMIVNLFDTMTDDKDTTTTTTNPVVMVPYVQQYGPYWGRFRNSLPWYGPRPGGRPYGGRYLRRHRRRNRRLRP